MLAGSPKCGTSDPRLSPGCGGQAERKRVSGREPAVTQVHRGRRELARTIRAWDFRDPSGCKPFALRTLPSWSHRLLASKHLLSGDWLPSTWCGGTSAARQRIWERRVWEVSWFGRCVLI